MKLRSKLMSELMTSDFSKNTENSFFIDSNPLECIESLKLKGIFGGDPAFKELGSNVLSVLD